MFYCDTTDEAEILRNGMIILSKIDYSNQAPYIYYKSEDTNDNKTGKNYTYRIKT